MLISNMGCSVTTILSINDDFYVQIFEYRTVD